jgi:peroxiredoxin
MHTRLHLPYDLLSDEELEFQTTLKLPTFERQGQKVIRGLILAIEDGRVVKWWYPIFLEVRKRVSGEEHPFTLLAIGNLEGDDE